MTAIIGWVRDSRVIVTRRTFRADICNALTSMAGGGHYGEDGLGNTTPYVMEVWYA